MRCFRILSIIGIALLCLNGILSLGTSTEEYLAPCAIETFELDYNQWYDINSITSISANYMIE